MGVAADTWMTHVMAVEQRSKTMDRFKSRLTAEVDKPDPPYHHLL